MLDYTELMTLVSGDVFEERPVDVEEFIYGADYLNMTDNGRAVFKLSDPQLLMVYKATQIYREETLISLYGEKEGSRRFREYTCNEIVAQIGKGGGKDSTSTIAVAYIVYLLMCLRDPATYFGKPGGDSIDIINIAINAQQAQRVFFDNFAIRIERSPWFRKKYEKKSGHFAFLKNINVYSGHSEREAWEGYNVIAVILDEISGFAVDSSSGNANAKTAQLIYDMYSQSVTSRFAETGKIILLSFPRFKGDFIQQRYDSVILEKDTEYVSEVTQLDPALGPGVEGNDVLVEWERDTITSYRLPRVWAIKRTSWEFNPTKTLQMYAKSFFDNYVDSLSRFACMPPDSVSGVFKDKDKVRTALSGHNGVDSETGEFLESFKPEEDKTYYVHVDLAIKHDRCAVAMAHVDRAAVSSLGTGMTQRVPIVTVDAIRYWTPTQERNVDFAEVRDYIVSLRQRGFNIRVVTFDRWQSQDLIKYLNNIGIKSEVRSVGVKEYLDFVMVVQEERVKIPDISILERELLQLRFNQQGRPDHPRTKEGSKDLADACAGAIAGAIAHFTNAPVGEIDIVTLDSLKEEEARTRDGELVSPQRTGVIRPPSRVGNEEMPDGLKQWLSGLRAF